jgi:CubicO group peptidase (beta-lactamase class C family)
MQTQSFRLLAAPLALLLAAESYAAAGPIFSNSGPDAEAYGASRAYPVPEIGQPFTQQTMIGWHSHYDQLTKMRTVAKGGAVSQLKRRPAEIEGQFEFGGRKETITDYLGHNPVTGLLIARDDTIEFEHYQYARTDSDRFLSNSMAKTVTGLLVGIAVSEGAIHSIDDTAAAYVPELKGTAYGDTPIRALLHMASGVAFRETYQPGDDIFKLQAALLWDHAVGAVKALGQFNTRAAPPSTVNSYSSADTEVLGLVVSRAVHMPLADYLSSRIWQKLGAESDAAWAIDPTGQEVAYCCMIAVLRDWARLGLMLAHDGAWNGQQIVPRQWLLDATTIAPGDDYLRGHAASYGYQLFILPGERRMFVLAGRYGQGILVDPQDKLVMVQTAVRVKPQSEDTGPQEGLALFLSLANSRND